MGVIEIIPSVGEVWRFSGTTQWEEGGHDEQSKFSYSYSTDMTRNVHGLVRRIYTLTLGILPSFGVRATLKESLKMEI